LHDLKPRLIPHDVVTWWNSTFDMMDFAWKYCEPIDKITADKKLKLHCYKLDNDDWLIIQDLLALLQVSLFCCLSCTILYVVFF